MTILLHVGVHKTGTTTIQRFAAGYRQQLRAEHGLWYPLYQDFGLSPGHYAHHEIAHALATDDDTRIDTARQFVAKIRSDKRADETVLISAEPICRHVYPTTGPDYFERKRNYIARLRALFPGDDVKIVNTVRRQDSLAKSIYQERIKAGRYRLTYAEFVEQDRDVFLQGRHMAVMAEFFPRLQLLVYEDLAAKGLVPAFFEALGYPNIREESTQHANRSLPIPLVEYKRLVNARGLSRGELAEIAKALQRLSKKFAGSYDWVTVADHERFLASFDSDNESLRRIYLPERAHPLFASRPSTTEAEVFGGLSEAQVREIDNQVAAILHPPAPRIARKTKWPQYRSLRKLITRLLRPNAPR